MEQLSMCRICLIKDVRMYCLVNTDLQEIYELLTGKLLETKDRRPVDACYECCARLRNCLQLRSACLHSEELFTHLLDNDDFDIKPVRALRNLSKVSLKPISLGVVVHTELQPKPEPSPSTGDQLDEEHVEDLEDNIVEQGKCTQLIQKQHIKCEDVTLEDDELDYSIQTTEVQTDLASDNSYSEHDPLESDISKSNHSISSVNLHDLCTRTVKIVLHRLDLNSLHKDAAVTEKLTSDDLEDTSTSTSLNNQPQQLIVEANTLHEFKKTKQMSSEAPCSRDSDVFNIIHTRTGEKPYKCDICGIRLGQKRELLNHIRTHAGEKPFKCDKCGKGFGFKVTLLTHIRTHTGEKPFNCDICGKEVGRKDHLLSHIRTHTGEKPFKCDICGKGVGRKDRLLSHIRTHTGEKPFKCDICGKGFAKNGNLITHNRTHTGKKPFKCNICGKGLRRKGHLLTHIRTHTGEKPFKCDICGKRVGRKDHLITHIRTHTE